MELNEESATLLAKKPTNAKAAIVKKLSHSWPITAKQMTTILQREFGIEITYQGVHKALTQLEEEKIIEKGEKGYQLHTSWIQNITQLANGITKAYSNNEAVDYEKEFTQITFHDWVSIGRFTAFRFDAECPNPKNKVSICNWMHVWPVVGLSAEETNTLQSMYHREPHYSISPSNTPLDKAMADWLNKVEKITKTGIATQMDHDYIVKGDHICQIYYPLNFWNDIDVFYNETKNVTKMNYKKLQELVTRKTNIQVMIIRNEKLADQIREATLLYFKLNKKKTKR